MWVGLKEHWVQSPNHDYCQYCNSHFPDRGYYEEHLVDSHVACIPCNRVFANDFGLHEHYRQSEHHHFCVPCSRHFSSASNLNLHLNSAIHCPKDVRCPFKCGATFVSRAALVLHLENAWMLTGGSTTEDVTYIATSHSWNGLGYECYLCHGVHKTLKALNQHLIYICCGPSCGYRCSTLSALFQHIETGKCGVLRFKAVQGAMDSVLGQMGWITM
ncbi:hypothetical protein CPB84DRAFT_1812877 [Gymnopilus junonius]|uniref:C2H2-type domain-containing protein n=1 Tax=Gymnopilus junonius TaxID=109634 RepID=A0A9P5P001_GYMJU|nr:hypothetical protein CPB84DRAFT_1812877 [Gymnopilus junonius]